MPEAESRKIAKTNTISASLKITSIGLTSQTGTYPVRAQWAGLNIASLRGTPWDACQKQPERQNHWRINSPPSRRNQRLPLSSDAPLTGSIGTLNAVSHRYPNRLFGCIHDGNWRITRRQHWTSARTCRHNSRRSFSTVPSGRQKCRHFTALPSFCEHASSSFCCCTGRLR